MNRLFDYDNKIMGILYKLTDCIFLNVAFVLTCIPIITIGDAYVSLFYAVNRTIRNDEGKAWKKYWSAFRSNFKQATKIWLIILAILAVLAVDAKILYQMGKSGISVKSLLKVIPILLAVVSLWCQYLFVYQARFADETKTVLKNCVLIAISNPVKSIFLLALFAAELAMMISLPYFVFIIPSLITYLEDLLADRIFCKYTREGTEN